MLGSSIISSLANAEHNWTLQVSGIFFFWNMSSYKKEQQRNRKWHILLLGLNKQQCRTFQAQSQNKLSKRAVLSLSTVLFPFLLSEKSKSYYLMLGCKIKMFYICGLLEVCFLATMFIFLQCFSCFLALFLIFCLNVRTFLSVMHILLIILH